MFKLTFMMNVTLYKAVFGTCSVFSVELSSWKYPELRSF